MAIFYASENCPECQTLNYMYLGDPSDQTVADIEGLECWKCGHQWLVEGADDFTTLEEAIIDKGMKSIK